MSPVVGVVLLLGVTVLLALVAAPVVFGTVGNFGSDIPDAEFSFLYEDGETATLSTTTDAFGTPVGDGHGLVTIKFQRGDTLDPANVAVRGNVSGGNLLEDTDESVFATGDRLRGGETISFTAIRGETVEVVWTGDGGDESAILGQFSINAPETLTPPWVPEADAGCEYIENQLSPGSDDNDISVKGLVVDCDLNEYYPRITNILITSENGNLGGIIGEVNGTGNINILNGGTWQGNVESGTTGSNGDVDIKNGSTVYSDVVAKGSGYVDIDGGSQVNGIVDAVQGVSLQSNSSVSGDIVAGTNGNGDVDITRSRVGGSITTNGNGSGNVDIDQDSTVGGPVDAMGTVDVQAGSVVTGPVISGTDGSDGKVKLENGAVEGSITVKGTNGVDVLNGSNVDGPIDAPGPVNVKEGSTVAGGVAAAGDIQLSSVTVDGRINATLGANIDISDSTVGGQVDPSGSFSCSNSEILSQSCSEYKQPALAVNITATNSPVSKGNSLQVDVTVENDGFQGTSEVRLLVDGTVEQTKQKSLSRNGVDNGVQFQWDTSSASVGEHNVTVESDTDAENTTAYVAASGSPAFGVESINSDAEVLAGNTLTVSATVKNSGQTPGSTTVRLKDFDGQTVDSTSEYIVDGESKTVTLEWDTGSGDIGAGDITVETNMDAETTGTEVLENVYKIEGISLYRSGQDLDVEVFLNISNNGTMDIEVFDNNGNLLDAETVTAGSDVYTMLEGQQAKNVDGEVVVTLYDKNGNQRDTASRDWNGGSP